MNSILAGFEVKKSVLPNGLRVLVREDHSAPVTAIFTHVLAGYFDEPDNLVGIAHVLEHMYFKGTPTRGPGEIAQATKSAGGYLNASTIYDHTEYYTVVPASSVEQGLDIQSDALLNPLIDKEELSKELQVIIQEANRKLDNPHAVARETLFELMFDKHRMRRWRIGEEVQLAKFKRADVAGFFEKQYRAENTILIVAGDIDSKRAINLVADRYGSLRNGASKPDRGPVEKPKRGARFREIAGDVVHTHIELGWHTQPPLHPDTPLLDLFALVVGQGRASRLYRLVRDAGLATSVSAHNYTPTELGVFGVTAECRPEDTQACIERIKQVMVDWTEFLPEELDRAKSILEARMLRGLETMEGQASFIAEWEALGDWKLGLDYLQQALSATADDVLRVGREYIDPENAALLIYRPESAAAYA
ncbi:MAG TPA: pitrilysin family protein [Longimicrobiales bacterium]|nr:pitrilysin family protein [Longimicrobiales bacterium]